MLPSWLAPNPRLSPVPKFGPAQQAVIDPGGIPALCEDLAQCPRHAMTQKQTSIAVVPMRPISSPISTTARRSSCILA